MEGFGGFFNDPDFQRRMQEMAEQMQSAQTIAWADNAIKLAVDMTVAAINRINIQGTTDQQAQQIRAVMATVFPEAVTLVREARQGLGGSRPASASRAAGLAAGRDDLLEGAEAEDEDERAEADGERGRPPIAICCADRVGGDRRAGGGAREDLDQQRLLDAGAARGEGHERGDRVDAEHEQDVRDRAADVERLEQEPERREAQHPRAELDEEDLAEVAAAVAQDHQALAHARPERPHARRQEREGDERQDPQRRSAGTA